MQPVEVYKSIDWGKKFDKLLRVYHLTIKAQIDGQAG